MLNFITLVGLHKMLGLSDYLLQKLFECFHVTKETFPFVLQHEKNFSVLSFALRTHNSCCFLYKT